MSLFRVSEVSRVSAVSKMSKQGGQQSLHSLLLLGEGGHRPDEGLKETGRPACTTTLETAKEVRSTIIHDETRHKAAEPASCKSLVPQCPVLDLLHARRVSPIVLTHKPAQSARYPDLLTSFAPSVRKSASHLITSQKAAFTLAEVLITLAVIGIVAALTLPGLIQNHNEKAWSTAKDLWEKKLTETVRRMNTDGVMTGHDTTENFMDTFKQYMKVIKTCDNNDLNKCYSPEFVLTGKKDNLEKKYIEDFKTANDLGISDWNTNTMSFVISDGTTVIAAYNPNCPYADPIEDTGSQVACLSMMIDVNGKKSPNRVGKDILLSNATISTCDNPIGDMCWSTDFQPIAIDTSKAEYQQYDSNYAYAGSNYWAGAKKTCSDMKMSLPTSKQLTQLAQDLYVKSDGSEANITTGYSSVKGLKVREEYKDNPPITLGYGYWYTAVHDYSNAYCRDFGLTSTDNKPVRKNSNSIRAVCFAK